MTTSSGPAGFDTSFWFKAGQDMLRGMQDFLSQQQSALEQGGIAAKAFDPKNDQTEALNRLQQEFLERYAKLWAGMLNPASENQQAPAAGADRRFSAQAWSESPVFDYIRQAYLLNADYLSRAVECLPVSDRRARERMRFLVRQYIDSMSPANFAATNPEFIKQALETKGESITRGVKNLISDMEKGALTMTDGSAFEVGRNLATTPGAVIFENELFQLLQYAPTTDKVHERPLLIVPPCINKYYILDLQPENSFVRHALDKGIRVFLVSWRNPGQEQGQLRWDDYIEEGVLRAIDVVKDVSGTERPNVLGFCVGGTMTACALSVAAARAELPVESFTLLTTILDFDEPGDLGCFIDEASVVARENTIGKGGLLTGRELSNVFALLRANDLIWSNVVENYLKGNSPKAFDLLYWNSDSTNLPGPFAAWYLRNLYLENSLRIPGRLEIAGVPADLGRITCPCYFLATREDHIVPWHSAYLGRRLMGGETTFTLGASGHIAGVINPAAKNRRSYWTNDRAVASAEEWFETAQESPGSWWTHWVEWLRPRSGKEIAAPRKFGNRRYAEIEPAPGRYVKVPA